MYIRDCEQREPQAMVQAAHRVWNDGYEAFVAFGLEDKIVRRIHWNCLLYTSPSPRDRTRSRMPSSA